MKISARVKFDRVDGIDIVFTPEFIDFLIALHDEFTPQIHQLRAKRKEIIDRALNENQMPTYPPADIRKLDWHVPDVPKELLRPGIEISGPASVTGMFINALNPGPDGTVAEGDLDDDEDASGHRLIDTVTAALNRLAAVKGNLDYYDSKRNKRYELHGGELPFFMHREKGLHLDETDVTIDDNSIPASILGMGLTIFHAGRAQIEEGKGLYFYLPKMESSEEARFWRKFLDFSRDYLGIQNDAVIRAIALIESLPIAYQMEEVLYELGPYAAGLNAARWDFKASIFEFIMTDPDSVWPDRFDVDIKTTEFLSEIFRHLVAVCLKRGAVPIGGMATALPNKDPIVNAEASKSIIADKRWEAEQGFVRAWVAHIFHMKAAGDQFKELRNSGWKPSSEMYHPENYPIEIKVPEGAITVDGTRRNIRMLIEYVEGWLNGRGAKGIDSLEGKPGIHPALMEDLATGRISVAQVAQRIIHNAKDDNTGQVHDFGLVKKIIMEEVSDILNLRNQNLTSGGADQSQIDAEEKSRYLKAVKISMRWIKNYTELNFRSLGSYTREDLNRISLGSDAF